MNGKFFLHFFEKFSGAADDTDLKLARFPARSVAAATFTFYAAGLTGSIHECR